MPSANDKMFDLITTRSIDLERVKTGLSMELVRDLQDLEKELVGQLTKIDVTGVTATSYQQQRLKALLAQTRYTIRQSYDFMNNKMTSTSRQIMKSESGFIADSINTVIGVDVSTVALTSEQIGSLSSKTLLFGAASKKWWDKQSNDLQFKFGSEIRKGLFAGETLSDLVRRVRGRRENGYKDGIMQASYRNATALVRTSVQSAANAARDATYQGNNDVIKGILWVSTLDERTTPLCIARDHREYTLEHESIGGAPPWYEGPGRLHWNCRSTSVPILKSWEELGAIRTGGRPTDVEGMFKNRLKEKGFSDEAIDSMTMNSRASMDGQVPSKLSFEDWVKTKPSDFQDRVFGAKRAQLFRDGKLAAKDLLSQEGRPLTLKQLEERANVEDPIKLVNRLNEELTTKLGVIGREMTEIQTEYETVRAEYRRHNEAWMELRQEIRLAREAGKQTTGIQVRLDRIDDLIKSNQSRQLYLRGLINAHTTGARETVLETLSTGKTIPLTLQYQPESVLKRKKGVTEWKVGVERGMDWTRKLFGGRIDSLTGFNVPIEKLSPSERSYHTAGWIHISGPDNRVSSTTVHEMGHWLEYKNARVNRLATEFLKKRIEGQGAPKWLGSGYGRNEVYVKDNFFDNYMGKIYPEYRSTEITSMGLQYMVRDPVTFMQKDPEYFNLMIQILRGA